MKKKDIKLALALLMATVLTAGAQTTLPFSEGFESFTNGDTLSGAAWTMPGVAAEITTTPAAKDGSDLVLYSPDTLQLDLSTGVEDPLHTNVWWSAYAQVLPQTNDNPSIDGAAAGFFVTDTGNLMAYSNDTWVTLQTGVPTTGWIRFSVQLDYSTNLYNIYKSADSYSHGDTLVLQNTAGPLAFNTNYTAPGTYHELTQVEVEGETSLDGVTLSYGNQNPITTGAGPSNVKVSSDSDDLSLRDRNISAPALRFYGESSMAGTFGQALASMLLTGDKVHFYDGSTTNWLAYEYLGAGGWSPDPDTSNTTITASTGMYFEFDPNETGERVPKDVTEFTSEYTETPETTIYSGWNLLALPFASGDRSISDMDLPVGPGDQISVSIPNGRVATRWRMDSSWWPSTDLVVSAGAGFWYRRAAAGSVAWNPPD